MSAIAQKIIGTWKLVHSVEIDAEGTHHYPFGDDAIGFIIYDAAGTMAVQISRNNRAKFGSATFKNAQSAEALTLPQDYLAYFGSYKIDLDNEVVQHFVDGALFPNYIGQNLPRKYTFYDDKLSLKPADGTNREILWQKLAAE